MKQAIGYRLWAIGKYLPAFIVLPIAYCLLPVYAWATNITADNLEYLSKENKYIATGNVVVEEKGAVIKAERIIFYQDTSDVVAEGNVIYEDAETLIKTEKAELNLDKKTGKLYNALIFLKKDNYWINGENIQKIKEDHYYATVATFTTCDTEPSEKPDWCFRGEDINFVIGKRLTAKNVTYRVKDLPVLYSPYFWTSIQRERETGFLFPVIGSSNRRGLQFSPSFFWAIDDNRDATFYLDYYSRRGIGKGIEYRYIDFNYRGEWFAYHIRDRELKKDFFELRGFHEQDFKNLRAYANINYINDEEFLREYAVKSDLRIRRFLQSTAEISAPFGNSRLYLLGQYWVDLIDRDSIVPQRLPEIGYVLNPVNVGPFMFTMTTGVSNFYREKEVRGQRFDINPTLFYAAGDSVRLFQSLSLRETAYNLENGGTYGSSLHRETFEYRASALTRFIRQYETFTHIIEPSLEYRFIPPSKSLPVFDSTELFNRTSTVQLSLFNALSFKALSITARLTQPYDFSREDNQLLPTKLEGSIKGGLLNLRFDMSHDFKKGRTETVNSEVSIKVADKTTISIGERYHRIDRIMLYTAAIDTALTDRWSLNMNIGYDGKGDGLRESSLKATYKEQCWAVSATVTRRPEDKIRPPEYSFMVFMELRGLGSLRVL